MLTFTDRCQQCNRHIETVQKPEKPVLCSSCASKGCILTVFVVLRVPDQRATDDRWNLPEVKAVRFDYEEAYKDYVRAQHEIIDAAQEDHPDVWFADPSGVPWEQYQNVVEYPDEVIIVSQELTVENMLEMLIQLGEHVRRDSK